MGFARSIARASAGPLSGVATPERWVEEWFRGDMHNSAGVRVDYDTAMQYSAFFAGVRVLSEDIASLPLPLYERLQRGKQKAKSHPLYDLLRWQPNPMMSSVQLRETLQGHALMWGNGVAQLVTNPRSGVVEEIWPLRPDRLEIKVVRTGAGQLQRWYIYNDPANDIYAVLPSERVLHIAGLGFDGVRGYSVVENAANSIGLGLATEHHGAKFFSNGSSPGGALSHPSTLSPEARRRMQADWENIHKGIDRSHRVAILEEGVTWQQVGIPNDAAQYLETRKLQVTEMARWLRLPAHKINDLERATFCLPAGELVSTAAGPVSIESVRPGERVWSRRGDDRLELQRVRAVACSGVDRVLEIRTSNRTLRCNPNHRVLVRRKRSRPRPGAGGYQCVEWASVYVPAGELKAGDTVVTQESLPDHGDATACPTREPSIEFMEFCGLLAGDGGVGDGYVRIARAASAPYMDHYSVIRSEFSSYRGSGNGRGGSGVLSPVHLQEADRQTTFSSASAADELKRLGLSGTAYTKEIPGWVFELPEQHRIAFLRGLLDSDGSVDKKGRISWSFASETLLRQVHHLCMSCGVPVTNVRRQTGTTTLPNGQRAPFDSWVFTCSDPGANRRIGSHDPRYQDRLSGGKAFGRKGRSYPRHGGQGFDSEHLSLARIVAIDEQEAEPVYDLQVEETESFVASGVVVHNSNIEQQQLDYVTTALRIWLERWEQAIYTQLLTTNERQRYFAEHLVDGLLRGDTVNRYQAYVSARQWGWLSANEVRELENMNPIPGGDTYLQPMNMVSAGASPDDGEDEDAGRGAVTARRSRSSGQRRQIAKVYKPKIAEADRTMAKRQRRRVRELVRGHLRERTLRSEGTFLAAVTDLFEGEFLDQLVELLQPVLGELAGEVAAAAAAEFGGDEAEPPDLSAWIAAYVASHAQYQVASGSGQIAAAVDGAEDDAAAAEAIEALLDEWVEERPERTARWESTQMGQAAARETWRDAGVRTLRWVTVGRDCPFCDEMDGTEVSIEEPFAAAGGEITGLESNLQIDRDTYHPPIHPGCDCEVVTA